MRPTVSTPPAPGRRAESYRTEPHFRVGSIGALVDRGVVMSPRGDTAMCSTGALR